MQHACQSDGLFNFHLEDDFCSQSNSSELLFTWFLNNYFSLLSCRLPDLVEYIVEPLLAGLQDLSSYVRRSAVMGCVKLYHLIPDFVEGLKRFLLINVLFEKQIKTMCGL